MALADFVILSLILISVIFAVRRIIKNKKNGKGCCNSCCGGSCDSCKFLK